MVHSTADISMADAGQQSALPPQRIYNVNDARFEGYQEPRPDGYQKAKTSYSNSAAIVIDNGRYIYLFKT